MNELNRLTVGLVGDNGTTFDALNRRLLAGGTAPRICCAIGTSGCDVDALLAGIGFETVASASGSNARFTARFAFGTTSLFSLSLTATLA